MKHPILVVDDDPAICDALALLLDYKGYTVSIAPDGAEALTQLQSEVPMLILLDLQMPVMEGREFIQELRRLDDEWLRTIPVVLMTAEPCTVQDAKDLGADVLLKKPFDPRVLLNLLDSYPFGWSAATKEMAARR